MTTTSLNQQQAEVCEHGLLAADCTGLYRQHCGNQDAHVTHNKWDADGDLFTCPGRPEPGTPRYTVVTEEYDLWSEPGVVFWRYLVVDNDTEIVREFASEAHAEDYAANLNAEADR